MENPFFSKELVVEYYDRTLILYFSLYSKEHVHHGLWNKDTKNLSEAIENTTRIVVDHLEIQKGDVVLDAGCGIGGSSRFIVENFGVPTVGITISKAQLKKAKELSQPLKNQFLLQFYEMDFTQTTFPDEFFSKIFAIESACYAPREFVKETYRLLKEGGKLVICDGIQVKSDLNVKEKKLLLRALKGWVLPRSETIRDVFEYLRQAGFKNINFIDKKQAVIKTSWRTHRRAKRLLPITYLLSRLKLIPKLWHEFALANYSAKLCLDQSIVTYGIFIAEK